MHQNSWTSLRLSFETYSRHIAKIPNVSRIRSIWNLKNMVKIISMDPPAGVTSFLYPFCVTLRISRRVPELSILFWISPARLECFSENPLYWHKIIKNGSLILRFGMTAILKNKNRFFTLFWIPLWKFGFWTIREEPVWLHCSEILRLKLSMTQKTLAEDHFPPLLCKNFI